MTKKPVFRLFLNTSLALLVLTPFQGFSEPLKNTPFLSACTQEVKAVISFIGSTIIRRSAQLHLPHAETLGTLFSSAERQKEHTSVFVRISKEDESVLSHIHLGEIKMTPESLEISLKDTLLPPEITQFSGIGKDYVDLILIIPKRHLTEDRIKRISAQKDLKALTSLDGLLIFSLEKTLHFN